MKSMVTKKLNGGRIRIARTKIYYKHGDGTLISVYPFEGPGTFQSVMSKITAGKLLRPTTAQTFSLIDFALKNTDDGYCKEIIRIFRERWFWTATENLFGNEDVILYDNIDGTMPTDRKSLINRMKNGDKAIRVVPYGFKTGSQSVSDLVVNPYIIGQVGNEDFAKDVVARVASKMSTFNLEVYVLTNPQSRNVKRYTAVYSYWVDGGLDVKGYYGDEGGGYSSGVLK